MSLSKLLGKIESQVPVRQNHEIVIPLIREKEEEIPKNEKIVIKLRSDPSEKDSQLYEVVTRAFDHGTPEQWIKHRRICRKILAGQAISKDADKFLMVKPVAIWILPKKYPRQGKGEIIKSRKPQYHIIFTGRMAK